MLETMFPIFYKKINFWGGRISLPASIIILDANGYAQSMHKLPKNLLYLSENIKKVLGKYKGETENQMHENVQSATIKN